MKEKSERRNYIKQEIIERDNKQYMICRECWEEMELSSKYWNIQKKSFTWFGYRCKKCTREMRRWNREKENIKRRERMKEISEKFNRHNKEMWYLNIQRRTRYLIDKLGIRPKQCPICWYKTDKVVAHHIDYSKPYEIVFCCSSCHRLIHLWELQIKDEYITTLCESEDGVQIKECEICWAKIKNIAWAKFCNGCREIANREYRKRWIEKNKFILNN